MSEKQFPCLKKKEEGDIVVNQRNYKGCQV